jgi:hypothetical protein
MDTERVKMSNPNMQIDDVVREMTDAEYAEFLAESPETIAARIAAPK